MGAVLKLQAEPRWRRHFVYVAVVAAYVCVFPYFGAVNNPNENVRVWAARALAHHGVFTINPVEAEWGEVGDRAAAGERRYSSKAPGTLLLGAPVHFVHDRLARLLTGGSPSPRASTLVLRLGAAVPPMALFLWIFAGRIERETRSPYARDLLTLGLGLGTMLYPYGLTYVGHAQSAALLFAGFLALYPAPQTGDQPGNQPGNGDRPVATPAGLRLAGLWSGLAVVFEYQSLVAAGAVAIYAAVTQRRRAIHFALGALGPAIALGIYHAVLFGRPWTLPYAHLADEGYRLYHHGQGFLGIGRPRAAVLQASLFRVDYGLLVFSPFLALGLGAALWAFLRRSGGGRAAQALILAVTAAMLVFLSGVANWRAGWCAGGPRYIAAVVPFLAFALALSWQDLFAGRRWARAALLALVLVSVFLCFLSGAIFPHFPLQFDNPIFDLVLPLLRDGYAPHSLGTVLGLRGLPSLLPLLLIVAAAIGGTLVGRGRAGSVTALAAVGTALVLLFALSRHGTRPRRDEAKARAYVQKVWEPAPPAPATEDRHGPA